MGFFGTYQFDGQTWAESDPDAGPVGSGPWLWLDIRDSDFATVRYAPAGIGTGIAFLNFTPRVYFEDDTASSPTDVERESHGLAEWWSGRNPAGPEEAQAAKRAQIADLLASDEDADTEPQDDGDIFAEIKAVQLIRALELPLPDDLLSRGA